jgi:hypothetical protein
MLVPNIRVEPGFGSLGIPNPLAYLNPLPLLDMFWRYWDREELKKIEVPPLGKPKIGVNVEELA